MSRRLGLLGSPRAISYAQGWAMPDSDPAQEIADELDILGIAEDEPEEGEDDSDQ